MNMPSINFYVKVSARQIWHHTTITSMKIPVHYIVQSSRFEDLRPKFLQVWCAPPCLVFSSWRGGVANWRWNFGMRFPTPGEVGSCVLGFNRKWNGKNSVRFAGQDFSLVGGDAVDGTVDMIDMVNIPWFTGFFRCLHWCRISSSNRIPWGELGTIDVVALWEMFRIISPRCYFGGDMVCF